MKAEKSGIQKHSQELVRSIWFDVFTVFNILGAIVTMFAEIAFREDLFFAGRIEQISLLFSVALLVELIIRRLAADGWRIFIRHNWTDIVSLVPVFRVFRFLRLFRLFRLFRLAFLSVKYSRYTRQMISQRRAEYFTAGFFLVFAVLLGTVGLVHFGAETGEGSDLSGWERLQLSFWTTMYTLFSGEYIDSFPESFQGKVIALLIQLFSLVFFAMLIGTVSALMIDKLKDGGFWTDMNLGDLKNHVLVCGWNHGTPVVIEELQKSKKYRDAGIVLLCEDREELHHVEWLYPHKIHRLHEDFTRAEVLQKAGVCQAEVAIIMSDTSEGKSLQDADARTVLAALTIEKLHPEIYTSAEISDPMNESHLRMGGVNEVIFSRDLTGHLLVQSALSSGGSHLLAELMKPSYGQSVHSMKMNKDWLGLTFGQMLSRVYQDRGAILVGIEKESGEVLINPMSYKAQESDVLLIVEQS